LPVLVTGIGLRDMWRVLRCRTAALNLGMLAVRQLESCGLVTQRRCSRVVRQICRQPSGGRLASKNTRTLNATGFYDDFCVKFDGRGLIKEKRISRCDDEPRLPW